MTLKKLAIAGMLVLLSGAAWAANEHHCGQFDKANWQAHQAERFEKHQSELHEKLKLSQAQENAWNTFQAQIKPTEKSQWPDFASLSKLNTLQRLDKLEALDKARESEKAQRSAAIRTFYAQLDESQKKVFDDNGFPQQPHHKPKH